MKDFTNVIKGRSKKQSEHKSKHSSDLSVETQKVIIGRDILKELSQNDGLTFRSIVEHLPEVFFTLGLDGTIKYLNPAFELKTAWSPEEWVGRQFIDIIHPSSKQYAQESLIRFVAGEDILPAEFTFIHKDGRPLIGEVSAVFHKNGDQILSVVGMVHDVTAHRQAQNDLLKSKNRLELLSNIATEINASETLDSIIENAIYKISDFFSEFRIVYSEIDKNGLIKCKISHQPEGMVDIEGSACDLSGYPEYLNALKSKKTIISEDITKDDRFKGIADILTGIGVCALIDVPVFDSQGLAGMVCLDCADPYKWTDYEVETLEEASETLSLAIKKAQLEVERKEYEKSLSRTLYDLSKKSTYESILSSVTRSVHQTIDVQEVFERAIDSIMDNIEAVENMSIYMVQDKEAVLKVYRGYSGKLIDRIRTIPYPRGSTWKTINDGKGRYVPDTESDEALGKTGREMGIQSYISMPIKSDGETVGCLHSVSFEKNAFTDEEFYLLEKIVQQLEAAIKNASQAEALRQSEERYRALFDQSPMGVYIFDKDCRITICNKRIEEILGTPVDSIVGFDISSRGDTKIFKQVKKVLNGQPARYEGICELSSGPRTPHVSIRLTPLRNENGEVVGGMSVIEDTTDRKLAEEKLSIQGERLRSLYQISSEPTLDTDQQILETIKTGCEKLGMDIGLIGTISGNEYTVLHSYDKSGANHNGKIFDLDKIYCKITLEADDVLALYHVGNTEYKEYFCYKELHLESYIAVPLRINGKIFGTMNFSSTSPRRHPFTHLDIEFIKLMGRWVSTMIERGHADYQLMFQARRIRALYEISADPSVNVNEQIRETLKTSAEETGLEIAGITEHCDGGCTLLYSYDASGTIKEGLKFELGQSLCSIAYQKDELITIDHTAESEYKDHPGYKNIKIESILCIPLRVNGEIFGSLYFASFSPRNTPFNDEDKDFVKLVGRWVSTMIERMQTEVLLSDKEELYRTLVENSHNLIVETKIDGTVVYLNSNHKELLGYDTQDLLGKTVFNYIHEDDCKPVTAEFMRALVSNTAANAVYRFKHKDGEWRWIESSGKSFKTANGEALWVIDSRDITERKNTEEQVQKSLKEKESLLREIHHRVKNNLQVISSLLSLQSDFSKDEDPSRLFDVSQNRISAIALIHEQLYQSEDLAVIDMDEYMDNLTRNLLTVYGDEGEKVSVRFDTDDVTVDIDTAIPCGLIINELFSNCLKHAFKPLNGKRKDGENVIVVGFKISPDESYVLSVSDNGVGLPSGLDFKNTESLGLQLVCTLTDQLKGNVALSNTDGTRFDIIFPRTQK